MGNLVAKHLHGQLDGLIIRDFSEPLLKQLGGKGDKEKEGE